MNRIGFQINNEDDENIYEVFDKYVDSSKEKLTKAADKLLKLYKSKGVSDEERKKLIDLEKSIKVALENTPSVVDVVTSSSVLSSDALKGLGFVPKYQALDVWDNLEKIYRGED